MNLKKTLKPIKKKIIKRDNIFRTIKHVYPHLSDLTQKEILDYYGLESAKDLELHVEKIKGILLDSENSYKKSIDELDACFCIDSHRDFKYLYREKKEALRQIEYSFKSKGIKLKFYTCPYHCGWHLSKV